jgi:DNA-binding FrmR family transcriptional regulator
MKARSAEKRNATDVPAACGCGRPGTDEIPDTGKRAVAVDPETKASNLRRLRRLEGQIRGLQKMVAEDRYCPEIMIQISAAQEALRTVGREIVRNHLRHCVAKTVAEGSAEQAGGMYDEVVEMMYKHSR